MVDSSLACQNSSPGEISSEADLLFQTITALGASLI